VDVFVNNAGTGSSTLALDMPIEEWGHVVATDLDGALRASSAPSAKFRFREMRVPTGSSGCGPSQQLWLPGWG
jgi:NAD(P)-dependent dehydrogenase (short-subunit alcohol dehydrogenase family)